VRAEESDFILFLSAFPSVKFRLFARSSKKVYPYHFLHTIRAELKTYYNNYVNTSTQEKRIAFSHFVRAYQEFYGYLISICNTIIQYYNLFVLTCNKIDPNNKEHTIFAKKLDIGHDELLAATKELLLHGNVLISA
jgi:hypothetical protein